MVIKPSRLGETITDSLILRSLLLFISVYIQAELKLASQVCYEGSVHSLSYSLSILLFHWSGSPPETQKDQRCPKQLADI